jgi:flagellar basal-body rod protein FlgB
MDLSRIGLFELAEKRLAWVDQRQPLLAQNIANADTPGFQPKDLGSFAAMLSQMAPVMTQTSPRHMGGTRDPSRPTVPRAREISPDGNSVSIETEMTKLAENDGIHQTVTQLYTTYMGMFRTALGKGS